MIRQESFNRSVRSTHIPKGFTAILGDLKWAKTARINAKKNFCANDGHPPPAKATTSVSSTNP